MGVDCLKSCSGCNRHVRCGERSCPFCGTAIQFFMTAPEYRLKTRLNRSATFALGAAFGAVGILLGCDDSGTPEPVYGAACVPNCYVTSPGGNSGNSGTAGSGTGGIDVNGGGAATTSGGVGGSGGSGGAVSGGGFAAAGGAAGAAAQPSEGGEAGARDVPSDGGAKP
jgi:hypothetical protein